MQELWFDSLWPLLVAMPFLGLLAAGLSKRREPAIQGKKVLRHDGPARIAHWTHAGGTVFLLVSGVVLGSRFTLAFSNASNNAIWFNIHFVFAVVFLFGTFYWLGNTFISKYRFKEHLPRKTAIKDTLNHYGSLLKIKGTKMPEEEKYFESERIAFLAALGGAGLMVLTGIIKVLAHLIAAMPSGLMLVVNWAHDIGAALMLLFLLAHIFFGVLLPVAWKSFPSIFTGYIDVEVAEHEYPLWMKNIKAAKAEEHGRVAADASAATGTPGEADASSASSASGKASVHQDTQDELSKAVAAIEDAGRDARDA